jgi:hypothetical protein
MICQWDSHCSMFNLLLGYLLTLFLFSTFFYVGHYIFFRRFTALFHGLVNGTSIQSGGLELDIPSVICRHFCNIKSFEITEYPFKLSVHVL